jgi:uncharacterized protein YciI
VADGASGERKHLRKLLYIIFSEPTSTAEERRAVHHEHLAHQYELERRGIMFAAGPFVDEAGKPFGPGMIIIRAESEAEARAIADADPYHKGGFRTYRLQRWMMNEGSFGVRLNYSDGSFTID